MGNYLDIKKYNHIRKSLKKYNKKIFSLRFLQYHTGLSPNQMKHTMRKLLEEGKLKVYSKGNHGILAYERIVSKEEL